jgi:hypothetical protein
MHVWYLKYRRGIYIDYTHISLLLVSKVRAKPKQKFALQFNLNQPADMTMGLWLTFWAY